MTAIDPQLIQPANPLKEARQTGIGGVLDRPISWFSHFSDTEHPQATTALRWLTGAAPKLVNLVIQIRSTTDPEEQHRLKLQMAGATMAGDFLYRKIEGLRAHSGLMCLDVDHKDNQHLTNFSELPRILRQLPEVAYIGRSCRGEGFFIICPLEEVITTNERHAAYYRALKLIFEQEFGIVIDKSGCNVDRLRFYSYDAEAYFNHQAVAIKPQVLAVAKSREEANRPKLSRPTEHRSSEQTQQKVEGLIEQLRTHQIDITSDYRDWLKIGCALAHEFGENGRYYFHQISELNPQKYDHAGTDKQYNKILQAGYSNATIASLFYLCDQYGVRYQTDNTASTPAKQERVLKSSKSGELETTLSPDGYPASWDAAPDAKPSKLVPSPRRKEWSQLLAIPESNLNLYTFNPAA